MTGCERRSCACWLGCAKACPTVLLHRRSDGPDQRRHARRGLGEDGCAHAWRVGAAPGHKTGSAPHGLLAQCPCAASSTRRRRRGVQATRHTGRAGARLRALLHEVEHGRGHGLSEGKRAGRGSSILGSTARSTWCGSAGGRTTTASSGLAALRLPRFRASSACCATRRPGCSCSGAGRGRALAR